MNSRMLKTPRAPGAEKFQKSVLLVRRVEKAICWNMKRQMSPAIMSIKRGI